MASSSVAGALCAVSKESDAAVFSLARYPGDWVGAGSALASLTQVLPGLDVSIAPTCNYVGMVVEPG